MSQYTAQNIATSSVTVWASQVQLSTVPSWIKVYIKAAATNAGKVYIGKTGVTANSTAATDWYELVASASVELELWNPSLLYGIASQADQKVFIIVLN